MTKAQRSAPAPARARNARSAQAVGVTALVVFLLLAASGGSMLQVNAVDMSVAGSAHQLATGRGWIVRMARLATFLGSTTCLVVIIVAACLVLWMQRLPRVAVAVVLCSGGSSVLVAVLKAISARPRPVFADPVLHANGFAFPSGHATNSTVVYGTLMLLTLSHIRVPSARLLVAALVVLLVTAIAASRVVLGVHWVSDVVAGIALGSAIVALGWATALHRYS